MIILVMIRQTKQIHPKHECAILHPYVSKHYSDLLFDFIKTIYFVYTQMVVIQTNAKKNK